MPTTRAQSRALRAWANALPVERPDTATLDQIERHLEFLAATLPSRAIDDESGKRRFAVYVSLLGGFSNDALAHMARRACETCDWFPTPKQCLELAGEYHPGPNAKVRALHDCSNFDHASFEKWIDALRNGGEIGDVPRRWIDIALTRAALRRLDDGTVVTRERFRALRSAEQAAPP